MFDLTMVVKYHSQSLLGSPNSPDLRRRVQRTDNGSGEDGEENSSLYLLLSNKLKLKLVNVLSQITVDTGTFDHIQLDITRK